MLQKPSEFVDISFESGQVADEILVAFPLWKTKHQLVSPLQIRRVLA